MKKSKISRLSSHSRYLHELALKYMEEHTRLLEALCRICGGKKGKERKKDVAKYADEIKQIWPGGLCVGGFTDWYPITGEPTAC